MSQCVPSWDNNQLTDTYTNHHHPPTPPVATSTATKLILSSNNLDSNVPNSAPEVPMLDYEVAELTWENGQLALHGLGQPRMSASWQDKQPGSSGTLESIVNQATCFFNPSFNEKPLPCFPPGDFVPWFNHQAAASSATMTMDALVPLCSKENNNNNNNRAAITCEDSNAAPGGDCGVLGGFMNVDSCSAGMNSGQAGKRQKQGVDVRQVPVVGQDWSTRSEYSANSSRPQLTLDTACTEKDQGTAAFTSTSIWSADNTSSGMPCTKLTGDDHDSICHSRSVMKDDRGSGENKKKGSNSVKRSTAAAIHNQSERKRRDKINQRMKTLQKLVPNSNKTDKASMLEEVIEYLKQLQAQVTMIDRMNMNMPQMMMMPMTLNQQALQMSMMGAAMGMGGMLDMNAAAAMAAGRASMPVQPLLHPSPFMHMPPASWGPAQAPMIPDPMSAFLACQSQQQPMTTDSYRMMANLYQQMQQPQQGPNAKS